MDATICDICGEVTPLNDALGNFHIDNIDVCYLCFNKYASSESNRKCHAFSITCVKQDRSNVLDIVKDIKKNYKEDQERKFSKESQ